MDGISYFSAFSAHLCVPSKQAEAVKQFQDIFLFPSLVFCYISNPSFGR